MLTEGAVFVLTEGAVFVLTEGAVFVLTEGSSRRSRHLNPGTHPGRMRACSSVVVDERTDT